MNSVPESEDQVNTSIDRLRSKVPLSKVRVKFSELDGFFEAKPTSVQELPAVEFLNFVTNGGEPVLIKDKKKAPYFCGELVEGPYVAGTRRKALKENPEEPNPVGRQRSARHCVGSSAVKLDLDGIDDLALQKVAAERKRLDLAGALFTTHSHGDPKKPGNRMRLVLILDRQATNAEFRIVSRVLAEVMLGGSLDKTEGEAYQQAGVYAAHPDRADLAQCKIFETKTGFAVSVDGALELAKEILPDGAAGWDLGEVPEHLRQRFGGASNDLSAGVGYAPPEESETNIQAVRELLGHVLPPDDRIDWGKVLWGILDLGWSCAEDLAREWAEANCAGHEGKWEKGFDNFATTFDPTRINAVGFGSIIHLAQANGWTGRLPWWKGESDRDDTKIQGDFAWVEEFNRKFAAVPYGGKMRVGFLEYDEVMRREMWSFMSFSAFKEMHLADHGVIRHNAKGPVIGAKGAWLGLPQRAPNRTLYFDPAQPPKLERDGFLNMWTGLAIHGSSAGGDAGPMLRHIREVVCANDETKVAYAMGWLAFLIQKPGERPGVNLVLRGRKGTGKGTLGNLICRILGRHALHIFNAKQLTGNFNAHLQDICFLFADEAFFAGDRSHIGTINGLTTEPTVLIEPKGVDSYEAVNRLSILMATNEDWVAPMTDDERRYAVMDVSSTRMGDRKYFNAMAAWAENDANVVALVEYLKKYDLGRFDVRAFPETEELKQQRGHSLPKWAMWWGAALHRGSLGYGGWRQEVGNDYMWASHKMYLNAHRATTYDYIPCWPSLVFPTPVGVFPTSRSMRGLASGLPHACGGVSQYGVALEIAELSSPRLWGCFLTGSVNDIVDAVFPTPVGVFFKFQEFRASFASAYFEASSEPCRVTNVIVPR